MRTTDEIYSALAGTLAQMSGTAVTEGGDMSLRLHAVAAEVFSLEAQADFVARQSFPQTAVGEYLDRHAALRGLTRGAAQKAEGVLRFFVDAPAAGELSVPAGTECRSAAGTAFVTTQAGVIAEGETECSVAAAAAAAGSGGNVPAQSVTCMILPPPGVTGVVNDAAFSGGTDGEDDEALRGRILTSYRLLPNGANKAYYASRVLDQPGVAAVEVTPRGRGAGTVDIVFAMQDGVPSDDKVAEIAEMLDRDREICVDIGVTAPTTRTVNITARLKAASGYSFAAVSAAAETALSEWFGGALLGKPVFRAKLQALVMAVEGVENCVLSLPSADYSGGSGVLPVLGTVSFSEAV